MLWHSIKGPKGDPGDPGGGAVSSVSSSDGSLTISPTTGAVSAYLNTANSNIFSVVQKFNTTIGVQTPQPTTSATVGFTPDPVNGFVANGSSYQFYVYSYYLDSPQTAYDAVGYFTSNTDPNDLQLYQVDISWTSATEANGYFIYDFLGGQYIDVGNVTSAAINTTTSWTSGSPPSSPTSITVLGGGIHAQSTYDQSLYDFTVLKMGGAAGDNLRLTWYYTGAGGNGALRFEDSSGLLKYINANLYAEVANITSAATIGAITTSSISAGSLFGLSTSTKRVFYSSSGTLAGDAGFEYLDTTNSLLVASASFTPQSKIHIDAGTGTASEIRFTAGTTTGQTSSDGFQIGITAAGTGEIRQRETLGIDLYTTNTLRAQWIATSSPRYIVYGGISANYDALANSSTDGLISINNTSATAGVPIQRAGRLRFQSHVWDTGAAATRVDDWVMQPVLTSANPGSSVLSFERQYNSGGYTVLMNLSSTGNLSVGNTSTVGSARIHAISTTEQLRLGYNASNYLSATVSSAGAVTFDAVGASASFDFRDAINMGTGTANRAYQTQISSSGTQAYLQFTTSGTGHTNTDGFILGTVDGTGVRFLNTESSDLIFYTSSAERVRISGTGAALQVTGSFAAQLTGAGSSIGGTLSHISSAGTAQEWMTGVGGTDNSAVNGRSYFWRDVTGSVYRMFLNTSGDLGIGLTSNAASARIHAVKTSEQLRLGYDTSNYFSVTVSSAGAVTFDAVGASAGFTFSDSVTMADAQNLIFNTTTGTKIGTATSQKIGLWNATPIVQPTTAVTAAAFVANTSGIANDTATFGGYTIGQVVAALKNIGALA